MSACVSPPQDSVSHIVQVAAIIAAAASTAFPPFWKIIAPAVAPSGLTVTASHFFAWRGGLFVAARESSARAPESATTVKTNRGDRPEGVNEASSPFARSLWEQEPETEEESTWKGRIYFERKQGRPPTRDRSVMHLRRLRARRDGGRGARRLRDLLHDLACLVRDAARDVRLRDDPAAEPVLIHDHEAPDPVLLHRRAALVQLGSRRDRDARARHAVARGQYVRVLPGREDAADDVAIGDDPDRLPRVFALQDRDRAAIAFDELFRDVFQARLGGGGRDVDGHDVLDLHEKTSTGLSDFPVKV